MEKTLYTPVSYLRKLSDNNLKPAITFENGASLNQKGSENIGKGGKLRPVYNRDSRDDGLRVSEKEEWTLETSEGHEA